MLKVLEDARLARIYMSKSRCTILKELAKEPRSVSQLARILGVSPPAAHYHIKILEKAKLARLTDVKKVRNNLVEKFYSAVGPQNVIFLPDEPHTRGLVPSRKMRRHMFAFDISEVDEVINAVGLRMGSDGREELMAKVTSLLDILCSDARNVCSEIMAQIGPRLSRSDLLKVESIAESLVPLALVRSLDNPRFITIIRSLASSLEKKEKRFEWRQSAISI